jgi:hypothetical protein
MASLAAASPFCVPLPSSTPFATSDRNLAVPSLSSSLTLNDESKQDASAVLRTLLLQLSRQTTGIDADLM